MSIDLAKAFTQLQFVAQDFAGLESFRATVPANLKPRICFEEQGILEPNAYSDADVYLLHSTLNNWSDKYANLMLKNLVHAPEDGAWVLLADFISPKTSSEGPRWLERFSTIGGMQMMTVMNSPKRVGKGWVDVIKRADERYSVEAVLTPAGAAMSVIAIQFRSGSSTP